MYKETGKIISRSTYQAAQAVAATIENHFAQHLAQARQRGEQDLAPEPSARVIEEIIDVAFWASLRREEGHSPRISIAFLSPEQAGRPILFGQRFPLTSEILNKLSPGVERAGIHLGVWIENDELYIWGTTLKIPDYCFVLDVSEPGLLVIKHRRFHGFGKFTNVAVLIGDQVKLVDEYSANLPDCPALLTSLLGFSSSTENPNKPKGPDSVNVLIQLAVSMRAHKRGGSLLIVPSGSDSWRKSIIQPIKYSIAPAFTGLGELMRQAENERAESLWQAKLRSEVDSIAGLTAVDGATIMTDRYELLAFGVKIAIPEGDGTIEEVFLTEPIIGGKAVVTHPTQNGGTRHLSAAQFVYDQRDALALVASQDGRFTIFTWSPCEGMVQGHRVDALLL